MFKRDARRPDDFTGSHRLNVCISALLIGALAIKFLNLIRTGGFSDYNSYGFTELLINYEGGFVRRGLLGELLYWLCEATGVSPFPVISAICVAAWGSVLFFFIRRFRQEGLCWWLVLSPLFLGSCVYLIRKDYLCYLTVITMFWILGRRRADGRSVTALTLLATLGIFLHEAFYFFGVPVTVLYLFADRKTRASALLFLSATTGVVLTMCAFKGDAAVAAAIRESWNSILPGDVLADVRNNSIGALAWDSVSTVKFHLYSNTFSSEFAYAGIIVRPLYAVCIYYFVTNFVFSFTDDPGSIRVRRMKTSLSMVFILLMCCMIPMFTVLSCDYGRLYQYVIVTAFAALLLLPADRLYSMFPDGFIRAATRIDERMARAVVPTRGLMVMLLFVMNVAPCFFNVGRAFRESVIGVYYAAFEHVMVYISHNPHII